MASVASKVRRAVDDFSGEDVSEQVAQLKQDIAGLTAALGKIGKETSRSARRNAEYGYDEAVSHAEDALAEIRSQAKALERQIRSTVRDNPITTVAVAAGVILLLAAIARR